MIKYIFHIDTQKKEKIIRLMNVLKDPDKENVFIDSSIKIYPYDTDKDEVIVTNMSLEDYLKNKYNKDKKK